MQIGVDANYLGKTQFAESVHGEMITFFNLTSLLFCDRLDYYHGILFCFSQVQEFITVC